MTITGSGFTGATAVHFGATAATSLTVNSDTQITATAPAAASLGQVDVTVTTPAGTSATGPADRWIAPGILEALIPGRIQGHGGTAEVPGGAA